MTHKMREENVVLVADDNSFVRFLINKFLGGEARVVEVGNGRDVLEAYKRHAPDIVFLDIHLPGLNGKDALLEVIAYDPDAFVVMISADSVKDNVIHSVRGGAKAFISKPFLRDTLLKYYTMSPTITRAEDPQMAVETA